MDILQNTKPELLIAVKVDKHKESEKPSQPKGVWRDMTARCTVVSRMGYWNKKKKKDTQN